MSIIHSFIQNLLSTYYVARTILRAWNLTVNNRNKVLAKEERRTIKHHQIASAAILSLTSSFLWMCLPSSALVRSACALLRLALEVQIEVFGNVREGAWASLALAPMGCLPFAGSLGLEAVGPDL